LKGRDHLGELYIDIRIILKSVKERGADGMDKMQLAEDVVHKWSLMNIN
jgi:hypothetical protein